MTFPWFGMSCTVLQNSSTFLFISLLTFETSKSLSMTTCMLFNTKCNEWTELKQVGCIFLPFGNFRASISLWVEIYQFYLQIFKSLWREFLFRLEEIYAQMLFQSHVLDHLSFFLSILKMKLEFRCIIRPFSAKSEIVFKTLGLFNSTTFHRLSGFNGNRGQKC